MSFADFFRLYKGKEVGIKVYILYHQDGAIFLYENKSAEYRLVEKLKFMLKGCFIEGAKGTKLDMVVEPGETSIVNILANHDAKRWSAGVEMGNYLVKRAA